ncbi:MAG: hypothetical protein E6J13_12090 [Chloroflexi bacterium]|nr:MAG: hypothetical protein E6J13_12090 [Chloroflexota bacterium]
MTAEGALAFLVGAVWLGAFVALLAWVTRRRLRSRKTGGRPLHLISPYLGGEMEIPFDRPPETSRTRRGSDR